MFSTHDLFQFGYIQSENSLKMELKHQKIKIKFSFSLIYFGIKKKPKIEFTPLLSMTLPYCCFELFLREIWRVLMFCVMKRIQIVCSEIKRKW